MVGMRKMIEVQDDEDILDHRRDRDRPMIEIVQIIILVIDVRIVHMSDRDVARDHRVILHHRDRVPDPDQIHRHIPIRILAPLTRVPLIIAVGIVDRKKIVFLPSPKSMMSKLSAIQFVFVFCP